MHFDTASLLFFSLCCGESILELQAQGNSNIVTVL